MSYLKEFKNQIDAHNYASFLRLWEEYCHGDEIDAEELKEILRMAKLSEFADPFGRHVEKALPLWKNLPDTESAREVLKLIFDIQVVNSEQLREIAWNFLQKYYGQHKHFAHMVRLSGIKAKENFQGCLRQFELLAHMEKGQFVFHMGGWGVGEILDVSFLREQLSLEFDYVAGKKDLSFANAFKTLLPIPKDHFLALRFGSPDLLEKQAKENPLAVIRLLLKDLGPKTAAEIKDELCDLVIPASEWTKWWQNTRAKIKKDTQIETPEDLKQPFRISTNGISLEDRLLKVWEKDIEIPSFIQAVYSFMKDFPETLKNEEFRLKIQKKLTDFLDHKQLSDAEELQILFFLQDLSMEKNSEAIADLIKQIKSPEELIREITILSFKKRTMVELRKNRSDWKECFLNLLFTVEQAPLRDYLLAELINSDMEKQLKKRLEDLSAHPSHYPEMFIWYFQKLSTHPDLPFAEKEGKNRFFESLLVLLSHLEQMSNQKELIKKIHSLLSGGRYLIVRQIMQGAAIHEVQEFLLLATKCQSLSDHDIKILHSLAEVVHPSLSKNKKKQESGGLESQVIWMTQEGYQKVQSRMQQIATVETVENARDIETARAHGDLRENMEFKAAREKRDRLQSELKFLSDQLNRARVITKEDVSTDEAGVGTVVDCESASGDAVSYTILGPFEADPDRYILSFQSKLAAAMHGLSVGDKFKFQDEEYTIKKIRNFFDKQ